MHVRDLWFSDHARLREAIESGQHLDACAATPGWKTGTARVALLLAAGPAPGNSDLSLPAIWLANVGGNEDTPADWLIKAVVEFARAAAADAGGPKDPDRRDRPLFAVPLVGTGHGGGGKRKGEMARELMRQLDPVLQEIDADVVLVTSNPEAFAAAQRARRMHCGADWEGRWRLAFAEASDGPCPGNPVNVGVGARRVDLLLDLVLAEAESALTYFMDPSFTDLLTHKERKLQSDLVRIRDLPTDESPVWKALSDFLDRLGPPDTQ